MRSALHTKPQPRLLGVCAVNMRGSCAFGCFWGSRGDANVNAQMCRACERPQRTAANWGKQRGFRTTTAQTRNKHKLSDPPHLDKTQMRKKLRTPGVEPGSQAWEACMMPLHYVRAGNRGNDMIHSKSTRLAAKPPIDVCLPALQSPQGTRCQNHDMK